MDGLVSPRGLHLESPKHMLFWSSWIVFSAVAAEGIVAMWNDSRLRAGKTLQAMMVADRSCDVKGGLDYTVDMSGE